METVLHGNALITSCKVAKPEVLLLESEEILKNFYPSPNEDLNLKALAGAYRCINKWLFYFLHAMRRNLPLKKNY